MNWLIKHKFVVNLGKNIDTMRQKYCGWSEISGKYLFNITATSNNEVVDPGKSFNVVGDR